MEFWTAALVLPPIVLKVKVVASAPARAAWESSAARTARKAQTPGRATEERVANMSASTGEGRPSSAAFARAAGALSAPGAAQRGTSGGRRSGEAVPNRPGAERPRVIGRPHS